MTNAEYLHKLKQIYNRLPESFEREIFYIVCKRYQDHIKGITATKNISKEEIIRKLIDKGLMQMSIDKKTGEEKLPDDRGVRNAVRKLMKNGLPILSSSTMTGYYIFDNLQEIKQPYEENKSRALSILAVQKGYDKMISFINGQISVEDIKLEDTTTDLE